MNKGINVRQDDILWRFYCKRFLVEGKEVEPPKNLCRYFWTSVKGFGLWLGREVRLRSFWLIGLVATAILVGMTCVIPDTSNIIATVLVVTVAVLWSFALLTAMLVSLYRVKRIMEARAPWLIYLLVFCFIVLVIAHAATQGILWSEFTRLFGYLFQWLGYMLVVMVAVIIIALVISIILRRRLQGLRRVFQTFGAFISAKKSRVCPPVNPPEDFKVKP